MINHIKRVPLKKKDFTRYKKDCIYRKQVDFSIGFYYYNKFTNTSYLICSIDKQIIDKPVYTFLQYWQDTCDIKKYRINKMIDFDTLEASKRQAIKVINDSVRDIKYRIDYGFLT